tara:strand:+ start:2565 stop:2864 length:300 start_codon:yes stop_codon:yes gene_type:complete
MLDEFGTGVNPDLEAIIYGPLLIGDGIKIRLTNIDTVDRSCLEHWHSVCSTHGYNATIEHNVSSGYVTINCRPRSKVSKLNVAIGLVTTVLLLHQFNII